MKYTIARNLNDITLNSDMECLTLKRDPNKIKTFGSWLQAYKYARENCADHSELEFMYLIPVEDNFLLDPGFGKRTFMWPPPLDASVVFMTGKKVDPDTIVVKELIYDGYGRPDRTVLVYADGRYVVSKPPMEGG